jgi:hypothetical protein
LAGDAARRLDVASSPEVLVGEGARRLRCRGAPPRVRHHMVGVPVCAPPRVAPARPEALARSRRILGRTRKDHWRRRGRCGEGGVGFAVLEGEMTGGRPGDDDEACTLARVVPGSVQARQWWVESRRWWGNRGGGDGGRCGGGDASGGGRGREEREK